MCKVYVEFTVLYLRPTIMCEVYVEFTVLYFRPTIMCEVYAGCYGTTTRAAPHGSGISPTTMLRLPQTLSTLANYQIHSSRTQNQ